MWDHALLVDIFFVQVFAFIQTQFGACLGFLLDIVLLVSIRFMAAGARVVRDAGTATSGSPRLRELFLLDPGVVYLNHGSFGACPRPVFDEYQRLQLELERQPVDFLSRHRRYPGLIDKAKASLAAYVGAYAGNLVFATNATEGLNAVARSLGSRRATRCSPVGEYGAVDMLWRHVCERAGARYVMVEIHPGTGSGGGARAALVRSDVVHAGGRLQPRQLLHGHRLPGRRALPPSPRARRDLDRRRRARAGAGATPARRASARTSTPAMPQMAVRTEGIRLPLRATERQDGLEPLVLSWDWEEETAFDTRRRWLGTRDPSAWLAVPAAIRFQEDHDWDAVRSRCHALGLEARSRLAEQFGLEPLTPTEDSFVQMLACALPPCRVWEVQSRLLDEFGIEALLMELAGVPLVACRFRPITTSRMWTRSSPLSRESSADVSRDSRYPSAGVVQRISRKNGRAAVGGLAVRGYRSADRERERNLFFSSDARCRASPAPPSAMTSTPYSDAAAMLRPAISAAAALRGPAARVGERAAEQGPANEVPRALQARAPSHR